MNATDIDKESIIYHLENADLIIIVKGERKMGLGADIQNDIVTALKEQWRLP